MHDDLLERRLRAALQHEADRVPFTITGDELERQVVRRRRPARAARRLTLMLAAALGIGAIGGGAIIGRLSQNTLDASPDPTSMALLPEPSGPAAAETPPPDLPTLDELLAPADADRVVLAHSRDPLTSLSDAAISVGPAEVELAVVPGGTTHEIWVACSGSTISVRVRIPGTFDAGDVSLLACDGSRHVVPILSQHPREVGLSVAAEAAWRVAVVRTGGPASRPSAGPGVLRPTRGDQDELLRSDAVAEDGDPIDEDARGRSTTELGALPARTTYNVTLRCEGKAPLRYMQGERVAGAVAGTMLETPCDGHVYQALLWYPEPFGATVYVTAAPGTSWSLLVTSDPPPVSLVGDDPGWHLVLGSGPDLTFSAGSHVLSGISAEGGGPLKVAGDCVGEGRVQVEVDLNELVGSRTFVESCSDGAVSATTFVAERYSDVSVRYRTAPGQWMALSVLLPSDAMPAD